MENVTPLAYQVFISYSSKDKDFAERVSQVLKDAKIPAWFDANLSSGDENYDATIRKAIKNSFAFVLIASPHSIDSKYVLGEIRIAQSIQLPIFPIWVHGESWVDSIYTELIVTQYVDAHAGIDATKLAPFLKEIKAKMDEHFPTYCNFSSYRTPEVREHYVSVSKDRQTLGLRHSKFSNLADFLDGLNRQIAPHHMPPPYGSGWMIMQVLQYNVYRLLAPWEWLVNQNRLRPIASYVPNWYNLTLQEVSIFPGSHWEFVDLNTAFNRFIFLGVAALSDETFLCVERSFLSHRKGYGLFFNLLTDGKTKIDELELHTSRLESINPSKYKRTEILVFDNYDHLYDWSNNYSSLSGQKMAIKEADESVKLWQFIEKLRKKRGRK